MKTKTTTTAALLLSLTLAAPALAAPEGRVNVNTASADQLMLLYRVGPAIAARIIEGRPYASVAEVEEKVKGWGARTSEVNAPYVAVDGETTLTEKVKAPEVTQ